METEPLIKTDHDDSYGSQQQSHDMLESHYDDLSYGDEKRHHRMLPSSNLRLELEDVSFVVREKPKTIWERLACWNKEEESTKEKTILHHINAVIPPGSLTAIMGPSGAGKSTVMDVLAHKRKAGRREGAVLVNGVPQGPSFRRAIAYCTQEDVLIPDLTVEQTLYYAARLVLPSSLGSKVIQNRVDSVIQALRLNKIRHSVVGGDWNRGISGGEKRRVSIGLELLTSPSLLLGDELTSGLDSYSAFSLMRVLTHLARDGNTVVLNIHQPSSTLFGMFDNLILLAEGRLIYEGPVKNVGNYFAELGFVCPPGWAMADFLLELVSRCGDQSNSHWLERDDDSSGDVLKDVFGEGLKNHTPDSLAERFVAQRPPTPARKSSESPAPSKDFSNHSDIKTATSFPNNWFLQVFVLIQRQLARWRRNPMALGQIFIMYIVSALIIGLLYSSIQEANVLEQYTLSAAFTLDMFGVLAFLNIGTFLKERALFNRESSAGFYYTSAYYMSGFLTSTLIFSVICVCMCSALFYLIDYPTDTFIHFAEYTLICFLNLATFQAMVEWLSASFTTLDSALLVTGNLLVVSMTLSGVTVNYPNIPYYLRFLYWGNHMTYLVSAVLVVIFEDFECDQASTGQKTLCGMNYLENIVGIQITDIWLNIGIACGFMVLYRFLTYLSLRFLHRET